MSTLTDNLELIYLSKRYKVEKGASESRYLVHDSHSNLMAIYDPSENDDWIYGVEGIYNSASDYEEIDVEAFSDLIKFTRLLSGEDSRRYAQ